MNATLLQKFVLEEGGGQKRISIDRVCRLSLFMRMHSYELGQQT